MTNTDQATNTDNQTTPEQDTAPMPIVSIPNPVTVGVLAEKISKPASEIIKTLMANGIMATINQEIDFETAAIISEEIGVKLELDTALTEAAAKKSVTAKELISEGNHSATDTGSKTANTKTGTRTKRPPIVTIMGHVDHGKTLLLDAIRQSNVVAGEAGGITQHIGAYQTTWKGKLITFLDTPGHEAFTAMRKRGANVTDVTVLVVAADDGVKPQTVEAIEHAKNADVPMIVAINKIDKPEANAARVKKELAEVGVLTEGFGGDTVVVEVSAKEKTNIEQLLEIILLVTDVAELKADRSRPAIGTVIEVNKSKAGTAATVIVQDGTLHVGDFFAAGAANGKVRAMRDGDGKLIKKAGPSAPAFITGIIGDPQVGDILQTYPNAAAARRIAGQVAIAAKQKSHSQVFSLSEMAKQLKAGSREQLPIVIKADVEGSAEAITGSLDALPQEEVNINILRSLPGNVNESDVVLAKSAGGIILAFNTSIATQARDLAEKEQVIIKTFNVIYDLIEFVKTEAATLLSPETIEDVIGKVKLLKIFKTTKRDMIIGGKVIEGRVTKADNVVVRKMGGNETAFMSELQCEKQAVNEVAKGKEAGMHITTALPVAEGDIVEIVERSQKARTLS